MANDYEKENKKLEKQNAKLKKKSRRGGKIILFLLFIIAILAALIFFFDPFGFGIGPNASHNGGGTAATPSATTAATEGSEAAPEATTEPEHAVMSLDVTVKGATYLIDGKEVTADKIVDDFSASDKTLVSITDDSATQNAMDDLKKALDAAKIPYSIQ
jgi:hypothetical protein